MFLYYSIKVCRFIYSYKYAIAYVMLLLNKSIIILVI